MTLVQYFIVSHLDYCNSLPTSFCDSRTSPLTYPLPAVAKETALKSDHVIFLLEILWQLPMPREQSLSSLFILSLSINI